LISYYFEYPHFTSWQFRMIPKFCLSNVLFVKNPDLTPNGWIFEHTQNKRILDSGAELQNSHYIDSTISYLKSFVWQSMYIRHSYWKLRSSVSIVMFMIWWNIFFYSKEPESSVSHLFSWWLFVIVFFWICIV
jgi:hypothetical protein